MTKETIKINAINKLNQTKSAFVAAFLFKEEKPGTELNKLAPKLGKTLADAAKRKEFEGEKNQTFLMSLEKGGKIIKLLVYGLGEKNKFEPAFFHQTAGTAIRIAQRLGYRETCLYLKNLEEFEGFRSLLVNSARGIITGNYHYEDHLSKKNPKDIKKADLVVSDMKNTKKHLAKGVIIGNAVNAARYISDTPSNMAHPEFVVSYAKELLKGKSNLTVEALGKKQLEELNMGALLGVGSGSTHEPKLLIIKYTADEKNKNAKIFIGKGLTFDSGGISIKPSEKMDEMKYDMCGGASVIGAMKAISELGYKTNVIGIVPLAENMPSGTAIRPGDILKSGSGKTIEVLNTDAEGRIVLADALWYAQKFFKPEYIVDLATLTGACLVALGTHFAAVLHNDEETKNKVMAAGKETGEKLWELPLTEEFKEEVKSKIADVQNMGAKGREGGTITGAAFLEAFVEKGTKWAHIDIAGMAYLSAEKSWIDKGGTGFGVATLARLAEKY